MVKKTITCQQNLKTHKKNTTVQQEIIIPRYKKTSFCRSYRQDEPLNEKGDKTRQIP